VSDIIEHIIERLRDNAPADHGLASGDLMREAADEIARLQRRCNEILDAYAETATRVMELRAELTVIHDDGRCPSWICERIEAVLERKP
jgi:bacterioferritin-associated ferredoxin